MRRIVSVDENFDLPLAVRHRQASHLADENTQEGLAVSTSIARKTQQPAFGKLYASLISSQKKPVRMVWVGSSTLEGAGASSEENQAVSLVTRYIQSVYPSGRDSEHSILKRQSILDSTSFSTLSGVQSLNMGWGGTASNGYISEAMRVKIGDAKPSVVFHGIGSNDQFYSIDPKYYQNYIQATIDDLKSRIDAPHIHVLMHMFRRSDILNPKFSWEQYRDALKNIAIADPENVAFIDIGAVGDLNQIAGDDPLDLMGTDNIHPTDMGHALSANTIIRNLHIQPIKSTNRPSTPNTPNPPEGGSLLAQDFFARSNGAVGVSPTGHPWVAASGTNWLIENNHLKGSGTLVMDIGVSDNVYVSGAVRFNETTRTDTVGLIARSDADLRRIGVYASSNDNAETVTVQIWIKSSPEANVMVRQILSVSSYKKGELNILGLLLKGNTVIAFLNGIQISSYTLTDVEQKNLAGATQVGYRDGVGSVHRLRNFSVKYV